LRHQRRSGIWNQPHARKVVRVDQGTHYEEDEVVFCVVRFSLVVKIDGFLSEGLVEPRSSF
jgi:hypothetical protein